MNKIQNTQLVKPFGTIFLNFQHRPKYPSHTCQVSVEALQFANYAEMDCAYFLELGSRANLLISLQQCKVSWVMKFLPIGQEIKTNLSLNSQNVLKGMCFDMTVFFLKFLGIRRFSQKTNYVILTHYIKNLIHKIQKFSLKSMLTFAMKSY